MKPLVAVLPLIAVLGACQSSTPSDAEGARAAMQACPAEGTAAYYFGPGNESLGLLAGPLRAAGASSLSCGRSPIEGYRLSYVPLLSRATFLVTVTREGQGWQASFVQFKSRPHVGPDDPFEVARRGTQAIPESEVSALRRGLERAEFSAMPTRDRRSIDDGELIAIEGRTATGYHLVVRQSPPDGAFIRTAFMFFELAGLPYPEGAVLPWESPR